MDLQPNEEFSAAPITGPMEGAVFVLMVSIREVRHLPPSTYQKATMPTYEPRSAGGTTSASAPYAIAKVPATPKDWTILSTNRAANDDCVARPILPET